MSRLVTRMDSAAPPGFFTEPVFRSAAGPVEKDVEALLINQRKARRIPGQVPYPLHYSTDMVNLYDASLRLLGWLFTLISVTTGTRCSLPTALVRCDAVIRTTRTYFASRRIDYASIRDTSRYGSRPRVWRRILGFGSRQAVAGQFGVVALVEQFSLTAPQESIVVGFDINTLQPSLYELDYYHSDALEAAGQPVQELEITRSLASRVKWVHGNMYVFVTRTRSCR